ncbi:Hypothetical protein LUCI_2966 [Lucifera butyrica]|uniref:EamA domain-containing protein n=1 Tax=Lucifera butyrica TaxID=1351585 RepID=A0A498R8J0_9FIRM|nr:EamA family transporter [Lucifera butyrica]VBB07701.1 Hypothetical protein LUCI_2966 [Lucifera butyrica]
MAVLISSIPVFSVLFAVMFLHEKVYLYTVISLIVNISGIAVIIDPRRMTGSTAGVILILLSAVAFAAYTIIGKKRIQYYGGTALTCFSFLFGSIEILLLILITRIQPIAAFFSENGMSLLSRVPLLYGVTLHTLPNLIFTGIFVTGLGYMLYFLGIEATSTATGSQVFFIKPALAPLLALLILKEAITTSMITGIVIIIVGSTISFIGDRKMRKIQMSGDGDFP